MLIVTLSYGALAILIVLLMLLFTAGKTSKVALLLSLLVLELLGIFVYVYFMLPSRNLLSILLGNALFGGIYFILASLIQVRSLQQTNFKAGKLALSLIVLVFVIAMGGEIHSYFSVKPTYNSLDLKKVSSKQAPTFKRGQTPIALAPKTVLNRVRKAISDLPNSQYFKIAGTVQAQFYQGKPVYIVPVEYQGFIAMLKAKEIPGYFMIDATSQNATPKFIKKPYKYTTSAYFNLDTERQLYRHNPQYLKLGDGGAQLEIDNNGTPYWVETVYQSEFLSHRINYQKLRVIVMNAQTGKTQTYKLSNLPKFVDEGITSDVANEMNQNYGSYKHGFWNQYFGKTDLENPTNNGPEDGVTSIFNADGTISYFTDFTNPNTKADSALGYSMINARTGELIYYEASGIMDSSGAKENANQNYKAQQWTANMPILYNVDGRPTWVMTILDKTSAIRGYYYLDAQDQSIYGTGSTPISALDNFRQALVNSGAKVMNTQASKAKNISGIVDRVAIVSNKNAVMFTLQNSPIVYSVDTNDFSKANLLRSGDQVKFKANIVANQSVGNVSQFVNENLK